MAAIAGLRLMAMNTDSAIADTMVAENCRYMTPVEPPKKTIGRNTADNTRAIATSAIWIWFMETIVASLTVSSGCS